MENIANARPLDYLKALPTDGAKITPSMLDSKSDLQDLMDGSEMFRVVKTVEPIDVNACPGLDLVDTSDDSKGVVFGITGPTGFSLTHGYLV